MDVNELKPGIPPIISEAIDKIRDGQTADSQESQNLEFKQDPAAPPLNNAKRDGDFIERLVNESIAFANADCGPSYIVIGISDKISGPEGFCGTSRDAEALRRKIYDKTKPNLQVSIQEEKYEGKRLLLLRVDQGIAVYTRQDGAAYVRRGKGIVPLNEPERVELLSRRINPDYTAKPSELTVDDLDQQALKDGQMLLSRIAQAKDDSTLVSHGANDLLQKLGLVLPDGRLKEAAQIMFGQRPAWNPILRYEYRMLPGEEPQCIETTDPLVTVFVRELIPDLLNKHSNQHELRIDLGNGQETVVENFPKRAIDEVITNAFIHRDWSSPQVIVIAQTGNLLRVNSPGSLPPGVDPKRLLTTVSKPRNKALMFAMRQLGLAEESSRGFDRMWESMLSTGRREPEVETTESHVEVILNANYPDVVFIQALARMRNEYPDIMRSVNSLILLRLLSNSKLVTLKKLTDSFQCSKSEAIEFTDTLMSHNIIQPLTEEKTEWILSEEVARIMGDALRGTRGTVSPRAWIEHCLKQGRKLTNREIVDEIGMESREVTLLLRQMRQEGLIKMDPKGPSRGSNVRWETS